MPASVMNTPEGKPRMVSTPSSLPTHLGHFLLTELPFDVLKASDPARIVCASSVARVDDRRLAFVSDHLEACGLDPSVAAMRARLLYTALIGEQHTSSRLSRDRRVEWALGNLEWLLRAPRR